MTVLLLTVCVPKILIWRKVKVKCLSYNHTQEWRCSYWSWLFNIWREPLRFHWWRHHLFLFVFLFTFVLLLCIRRCSAPRMALQFLDEFQCWPSLATRENLYWGLYSERLTFIFILPISLSLSLSFSLSLSLSLEWWRAVPNCPLLPTNIRPFYPQPSTGQSKKHLSHDLGVLVTWLQCVGHMTSLSLSLQNQVIKRYGDEAESSAGYYADYQRNYITSPLSSDQFRTNINLLKEATCESDTSLFEQVNS